MAKKGAVTVNEIDALLEAAGVNVTKAKADVAKLKAAFSAGKDPTVPDGALQRWAADNFGGIAANLPMVVGRIWLKEA